MDCYYYSSQQQLLFPLPFVEYFNSLQGLSVLDDKGLFFVKKIDGNSFLAKDGRMRIGDRILAINGKSLENMTLTKVK